MISAVISRLCILLFGTLYPAYASYKAVRTKNVKEYVKWMMYWIVFALFTCAETFTDVLFNWFPFYYEIKIILVFWLLSPATKGSSILYRKFVHPALCRREQEIDECISKAKEQGYHTVLNLGTKGVNYATNVIMQTAIRGGGGLVQQLRKSYSLSDLSASDDHSDGRQELDETDDVVDSRLVRRNVSTRGRSPRAASSPRVDMFFPEVDVNSRSVGGRDNVNLGHIRSSEDISSSYIPENLSNQDLLTRTASVGGSSRTRSKVTRSTFTSIKRPGAAEDNEVIIEEIDDDTDPSYYTDVQNVESTAVIPYLSNIPNLANNFDKDNIESIYQKYLQLKDLFDSPIKTDDSSTKTDVIVTNDKINTDDAENKNQIIDDSLNISTKLEVEIFTNIPDIKIDFDVNKNEGMNESENINNAESSPDIFLELNKNDDAVSSSNVSSDNENSDGEFNTPNSSPVSSPKARHKKRPAPPPPITIDSISDVLENLQNESDSIVQSDTKLKLKSKDKKSLLKLLPSKLAFWKSDDALNNLDKLDAVSNSGSSVYDDSDAESLVKTSEHDIANKTMGHIISDLKKLSASLDSLNEQFLDATEPEAKIADDTQSIRHIPLRVDSHVTYTGSKSTDV